VTRPLVEIEAEAALVRKRSETLDRIWRGGLTAAEERLEREKLDAIGSELAALNEKRAPPPVPPVIANIETIAPADAAKRAAEIRARPEYFTGRTAEGERLPAAEHERLVREAQELTERAAATAESA
jgi:hypothetical protein